MVWNQMTGSFLISVLGVTTFLLLYDYHSSNRYGSVLACLRLLGLGYKTLSSIFILVALTGWSILFLPQSGFEVDLVAPDQDTAGNLSEQIQQSSVPVLSETLKVEGDHITFRILDLAVGEALKEMEAYSEEIQKSETKIRPVSAEGWGERLQLLYEKQDLIRENLSERSNQLRDEFLESVPLLNSPGIQVEAVKRELDYFTPAKLLTIIGQSVGLLLLFWLLRMEKAGKIIRHGVPM